MVDEWDQSLGGLALLNAADAFVAAGPTPAAAPSLRGTAQVFHMFGKESFDQGFSNFCLAKM